MVGMSNRFYPIMGVPVSGEMHKMQRLLAKFAAKSESFACFLDSAGRGMTVCKSIRFD
jgi:hypothetical protein